MKTIRLFRFSVVACLLPFLLGPVLAQQSELVNVEISNVANNMAKSINVDISQIPVTVQAPIGIAANVCGVNANVLAQQAAGLASCTATTASTALNRIVLRQIKATANQ